MSIAVLSALNEEIDLLVDSLQQAKSDQIADWPVWTGRFGRTEVIVAAAGIGKVNTAALTALVSSRYSLEILLFSGVAGGLNPSLGIGDIVVGERTIQHDAGVTAPDGLQRYQAGHIPFYNPTDEFGFTPSANLLEAMRTVAATTEMTLVLDRDPEIVFGTILTGDQFVSDEATRVRLFADLSAEAVEMEGGALAQTATCLGVDHLVVRSLSDLAGAEAVSDFDRFLPEVAANSAHLVLGLIERIEENDRDLTIGT